MKTGHRRLTLSAKSRARILRSIRERFERDPESLSRLFPEIYDELSTTGLTRNVSIPRGVAALGELTEIERRAHEDKLHELIGRSATPGILTTLEGMEILEHLIALDTSKMPTFGRALSAAEGVLKVSFSEEKNQTKVFRKGRAARIHNLLPGIQVYLTWDGKLLRIRWNMKEIQWRNKALSFVGAAGPAIIVTEAERDQFSPRITS